MARKMRINRSGNGEDSPKSSDDENSRASEFVLDVARKTAGARVREAHACSKNNSHSHLRASDLAADYRSYSRKVCKVAVES
jgi:hypothetical protein